MNTTAPSATGSRSSFAAECNKRRAKGWTVTGNTYWVKDQLKAMGGIWDPMEKAWLMPDQDAFERGMALANPPKKTGSKSKVRGVKPVLLTDAGPMETLQPTLSDEAIAAAAAASTATDDMPF